MDNKQVIREMLKDFQAKYIASQRSVNCPFRFPNEEKLDEMKPDATWVMMVSHHDLCAILFPSWAKEYLSDKVFDGMCPCYVMSHSYVRRRARKFVKEGR